MYGHDALEAMDVSLSVSETSLMLELASSYIINVIHGSSDLWRVQNQIDQCYELALRRVVVVDLLGNLKACVDKVYDLGIDDDSRDNVNELLHCYVHRDPAIVLDGIGEDVEVFINRRIFFGIKALQMDAF